MSMNDWEDYLCIPRSWKICQNRTRASFYVRHSLSASGGIICDELVAEEVLRLPYAISVSIRKHGLSEGREARF